MIGGVYTQQQVILAPQRVDIDELDAWAPKHLRPTDEVLLEATTNPWTTYDLIAPLVKRCVVVNPLGEGWIAEARVKTDAADVLCLARLLAANLAPKIWVPLLNVRELRSLMPSRRRVVKMQPI